MFSNYEGTLQALNERKYFSQMGQIISTMQNKTFLKNRLERNFTFVLLNSGLLPDETQFKTFFFPDNFTFIYAKLPYKRF